MRWRSGWQKKRTGENNKTGLRNALESRIHNHPELSTTGKQDFPTKVKKLYHCVQNGKGHDGLVTTPVAICKPSPQQRRQIRCADEQGGLNAGVAHGESHDIHKVDRKIGREPIERKSFTKLIPCTTTQVAPVREKQIVQTVIFPSMRISSTF